MTANPPPYRPQSDHRFNQMNPQLQGPEGQMNRGPFDRGQARFDYAMNQDLSPSPLPGPHPDRPLHPIGEQPTPIEPQSQDYWLNTKSGSAGIQHSPLAASIGFPTPMPHGASRQGDVPVPGVGPSHSAGVGNAGAPARIANTPIDSLPGAGVNAYGESLQDMQQAMEQPNPPPQSDLERKQMWKDWEKEHGVKREEADPGWRLRAVEELYKKQMAPPPQDLRHETRDLSSGPVNAYGESAQDMQQPPTVAPQQPPTAAPQQPPTAAPQQPPTAAPQQPPAVAPQQPAGPFDNDPRLQGGTNTPQMLSESSRLYGGLQPGYGRASVLPHQKTGPGGEAERNDAFAELQQQAPPVPSMPTPQQPQSPGQPPVDPRVLGLLTPERGEDAEWPQRAPGINVGSGNQAPMPIPQARTQAPQFGPDGPNSPLFAAASPAARAAMMGQPSQPQAPPQGQSAAWDPRPARRGGMDPRDMGWEGR